MNELNELIEKWDKQIALHRSVCENTLMYTKEDMLKNSHYAQAICAVVADLKKLNIPDVSQKRELLLAYERFSNSCECDACKTAITEKLDAFLSQ